jgi:hypothetical protein
MLIGWLLDAVEDKAADIAMMKGGDACNNERNSLFCCVGNFAASL